MMQKGGVLLTVLVGVTLALHPLSDEFIDSLNKKAVTWQAGRNFHEDTSFAYLKGLLGVRKDANRRLPARRDGLLAATDLPKSFDSRTKWPHCPSISEIRDQSSCGSCWAISSAEVMSDRQCIHKGELFHYSTWDILSCCQFCGVGCNGGSPSDAFEYWRAYGVVSGGLYNSSQGCMPYPLNKCEHHEKGKLPSCNKYHFLTPECPYECEKSYNKSFKDDKRKAKYIYSVEGETNMMKEIVQNGPIEGSIAVYEDFLHYKSGVYQHLQGTLLGYHAIRILGYGREGDWDYWLVANSWNAEWGDKGYIKMERGYNGCGIESDGNAGIPE